jgi:hypothetical protein
MKLSKSDLKNLIKEELQNLDEIIGAASAAKKGASLMAGEDIFAAEKAEEFSEKSMGPHVKRLTDEVISLRQQLRYLKKEMEAEINELKAAMAGGGPTS